MLEKKTGQSEARKENRHGISRRNLQRRVLQIKASKTENHQNRSKFEERKRRRARNKSISGNLLLSDGPRKLENS